jgi:uncharacterized protein YjbI with pentapeptide repeats
VANPEHVEILKRGVKIWNNWRKDNPIIEPDLRGSYFFRADLAGVNLSGANLYRANLGGAKIIKATLYNAFIRGANLKGANLSGADLRRSDLVKAKLMGAVLEGANLMRANLSGTNLGGANLFRARLGGANLLRARLDGVNLIKADLRRTFLREANLSGANLSEALLLGALLLETNLEGTNISNTHIYGISAWNLKLNKETEQSNLIITPYNEPVITVDNLEVAQFVYLLLNNEKIRDVINTITTKAVLILGRFSKKRKDVLDAIREELRKHGYVPILFDFEKPATKDLHETITTLARMVRFIIADITNPKSIPQELTSIVEQLPSLPVKPILRYGAKPWAMFDHIRRYPWVLEIHKYRNLYELLGSLKDKVILDVENKAMELE